MSEPEARNILLSLPNLRLTSSIIDIDEIIATIRKEHKSKAGLSFVYIDYLQTCILVADLGTLSRP